MKLMDFTSLPIRKKSYGGANGNKISVVINDELYMLKYNYINNDVKKLVHSNNLEL